MQFKSQDNPWEHEKERKKEEALPPSRGEDLRRAATAFSSGATLEWMWMDGFRSKVRVDFFF